MSDVPDGKTPAARFVDIEGAPIPDLGAWMKRPAKGTTVLSSQAPGPAAPQGHLEVPPAPVVDLNAMFDRVTRRLADGLGAGIEP